MPPFLSWKERLFANHFIRSLSVVMAGTALSNVFVIVTTPILTRLYTPEEFGSLSVFLSILYTLTIITSFRYETAIPIPEKDEDAFHLFILSAGLVVVVSVLTCVTIFGLKFAGIFQIQGIQGHMWILSISLFGIGMFQVLNCWALRTEEYSAVSKSKVMMNGGQVVSQVFLGFIHPGVLSLLIGEVAGRITGTIAYLKTLNMERFRNHKFSVGKMKDVMVRYKSFPLLSSWSALINSLGNQAPVFFLVAAFDSKTAGFFFLAQKVLTIPEGLLGFSASQVYLSQSAHKARQSSEQFRKFFWDTIIKMSVMGVVAIGAVTLLAPLLIETVFGASWKETGKYIQALSILYTIKIVINPLTANFYVFEALKIQIVGESIRFILILLSLIIVLQSNEDPVMMILWMSIGSSIGYCFIGFLSWYVMKRHSFMSPAMSEPDILGEREDSSDV